MVRLQAERDEAVQKQALNRQLVDLLRRRLERIPAKERPQYAPEDRFQILQLIRLQNWNLKAAAKNLVLNEETLRRWFKKFRENPDAGLFFGTSPWNKLSDGTRWVAKKIKELCPIEGTRKIAILLLQAGIQMSRSTVQRVLREEKHPEPQPTAGATKPATDQPVEPAKEGQAKEGPVVKGYHILNPKKKNRTWHADLTTFDFVFIRFYVAVILDGFSRKALALKVYHDAPAMPDMIDLVRAMVGETGKFRFIVTDHGCQFGEAFKDAVKALGGTVVKGRVGNPRFNGKAEAFFKILKGWRRLRLLVPNLAALQRRLDIFCLGSP
jgi:transposase InsO family protein